MDGPEELARALAENAALLGNITGDLDRMPSFKRGTRWHLDRAAERRRLLSRRESLRSQLAVIAERN
jgi:hypothetical protein